MTILGMGVLIVGIMALLLASIGLFVLQDALSRQHAATKAGSLGIVLIVTGTAVIGGSWAWWWRAALIVVLTWLTMPMASHVLARAAIRGQLPEDGEGSIGGGNMAAQEVKTKG